MTLTNRHIEEVCLLHQMDMTKTCRYLVCDDLEDGKWYCQKMRSETKARIDGEISTLDKASLVKLGIPAGDNCEGFPLMKHMMQGFDLD